MQQVVKYGNRLYLVQQDADLGGYVAVDRLTSGEVRGLGTVYEQVVLNPRTQLEDRQVFVAHGDEAQEYTDMGTRELLEVLDNRGLL